MVARRVPSSRRGLLPALRRAGRQARASITLLSAAAVGAVAGIANAQSPRRDARPTNRGSTPAQSAIEPSSREAASWLAEQPGSLPYRLALARALLREGHARASLPHFERVVARDSSPTLLGEAAAAHAAAGAYGRAVDLYRLAVDRAPSHAPLRSAYARALVERARAHLDAGDDAAASRDLEASIVLRPTAGAYALLGDAYRSRAQLRRARAGYERALALRPDEREAAARLAELAREERPDFGYAARVDKEPGVAAGAETLTDNAGFAYVWGEARFGFRVRTNTVLGFGLEPRVVRERFPTGVVAGENLDSEAVTGVGATVGFAHQINRENVEGRLAARAGAVGHSAGGSVALFTVAASTTYRGAWSAWLEVDGGPAYAELLALGMTEDTSALPAGTTTERFLSLRSLAGGLVIPLGVADVAARLERLLVSDGNARSTVEVSARLPIGPGVSLLYAAGAMAFRDRSALYWDPRRDVFHALGFETGARSDEGFAWRLRALPGLGRTREGLTPGHEPGVSAPARVVWQFAADAEVGLERPRWDAALGASLATGRSGGYRQFEAGLRVRYAP